MALFDPALFDPALFDTTGPPVIVADIFPGDLILADSEEPLIRAMSDIEAEGMLAVRAELILENWDPALTQLRNLPYLRWALDVSLWDETWTEASQRAWVAQSWEFKARRGTERGLRMALTQFGYDLVGLVTPPQGFYLTADVDPNEHPSNVFHGSYLGVDRIGFYAYSAFALINLHLPKQYGFFVGHGIVEVSFINEDDLSHANRARRAVIAAKALRDDIFVSFAHLRPRIVSDGLLPGSTVGLSVPRQL
jgi:hypothetical protein